MKQAKLVAGEFKTDSQINFWLVEEVPGTITLRVKHSDDASAQGLIDLFYDSEGILRLRRRDIHTANLCAALGVAPGGNTILLDKGE